MTPNLPLASLDGIERTALPDEQDSKEAMRFALILLTAICVGCAHVPTDYAPSKDTRAVRVETEPPGMQIFYGIAGSEERAVAAREYVGTSPCVAVIKSEEDAFPNFVGGFARPKAVFMAEPPSIETNLLAQRQVFSVPAIFIRSPPIPKAVFFDMHKVP